MKVFHVNSLLYIPSLNDALQHKKTVCLSCSRTINVSAKLGWPPIVHRGAAAAHVVILEE